MTKTPPVELEFSRKYDRSHSEQYLKKHHEGWARRLSHWRDEQVARHALRLADDPGLVLDLPCGAGRFWPLLAEAPYRVILAADNSADMLAVARASQPADVVARWAPGGSVIDHLDPTHSRLTLGAWSWAGIAGILATFDTDLTDVEPDELRAACHSLARRFGHT